MVKSNHSGKGAIRIRPTAKQAIHASFRRLLLAKSLDKITVRDIVEDCGLTRNTFYYHYEDIYDLFDDFLDTQMHDVWQSLPHESNWDAVLMRLLECICETPQMGRHVFFSKKREAMRLYLNKVLAISLDRYLLENLKGLSVSADDRRLICDTCSSALYGLIEQWLTGPDASLLKFKLGRVLRSFEGAVRQALEYCANHPSEKEEPF